MTEAVTVNAAGDVDLRMRAHANERTGRMLVTIKGGNDLVVCRESKGMPAD